VQWCRLAPDSSSKVNKGLNQASDLVIKYHKNLAARLSDCSNAAGKEALPQSGHDFVYNLNDPEMGSSSDCLDVACALSAVWPLRFLGGGWSGST
jgi:hypothetical protein